MKSKKPPAAQNTDEKRWVAPNQRQLFEAVASVPHPSRSYLANDFEIFPPSIVKLLERQDAAKAELEEFELYDANYNRLKRAAERTKTEFETAHEKYRANFNRERNQLENRIRLYGPTKAVIAAVRKFVEKYLK